jgi:hypothetical protein
MRFNPEPARWIYEAPLRARRVRFDKSLMHVHYLSSFARVLTNAAPLALPIEILQHASGRTSFCSDQAQPLKH